MEFVTLHELSKEFDLPARVVRYRFHQLRKTNKLIEGDDCRREDFVDDQHFVWKINPLSFIRETGLTPVSQRHSTIPFSQPVTEAPSLVNQPVNESGSPVNNPASEPEPVVAETQRTSNQVDNKAKFSEPLPTFEHEIIDFLKEQIHTKDGQLREQGEQLRELSNANARFMGAVLQQAQKIEELLRLTSGSPPLVNKPGSGVPGTGDNAVNETSNAVNQPVNHLDNKGGTIHSE